MQRSISDIKAALTEVRASRPRASASISNGSFREHLSAIRKEDSFNTAAAPLLRSRAYHAGKNPMKFGIVQATLKDYDPKGKIAGHVSELDEKKAAQIYRMIWERAGCSRLSPELAAQHFTAYVKRPRTAIEALQKSGGDPGKYAAAINSAGNKTSYAAGHAQRQPLSNVAEVSGPTHDMPESRGGASLLIPEKPAVRQTAVDTVMPLMPQASGAETRNEVVEVQHKADKGSSSENAVKESDSPSSAVQLKPFRASEVFQNIQSSSTSAVEIPIADNGMKIVFEKRENHAGIQAYESAKSGKVSADGVFVKLRIPF